jgi:hypothetical protein
MTRLSGVVHMTGEQITNTFTGNVMGDVGVF